MNTPTTTKPSPNTTKSLVVEPLNQEDYTACFDEYKKWTNEYQAMAKLSDQALTQTWAHKRQEGRMLSIGAGSGNFDLALMQQLDWQPALYVAVEPNDAFRQELDKACQEALSPDTSVCILSETFTDTTPDFTSHLVVSEETKFDVIVFAHCFYHFVDDPAGIIKRCRDELLAPQGKILIYIQTEGCVTELCRTFHPRWTFAQPLTQDYLVTDQSLLSIFSRQVSGMKFQALQSPSRVIMDSIVVNQMERVDQILSFILQTNIASLPHEMQQEIRRHLLFNMVQSDSDHKAFLAHDSALIICQHDH